MHLSEIIKDKNRFYLEDRIPKEYKSDHFYHTVAHIHAVALPAETEEVIGLVKYAIQKDIPIVVRGAGTGVTGAQVPFVGGELIIDMKRMNRILELDEETMTLTVEPGVLLQDIQEFTEQRGYFYPPDPGSKHSTIGGNVATNAGGMRAVKYGTTKDYVRELEVVLPDGNLVTLGSLNIKSSSGYDLKSLFIGSEGTLGITTKIKLKLLSLPKYKRSILLAFSSLQKASTGVLTILKNGIEPTALELFEKSTIEYSERFLNMKLPCQSGEAYILMTIDGNNKDVLQHNINAINQLLANKSLEIVVLENEEEEKKAWKLRDNILVALMQFTQYEMLDEVVPINKISELIHYTKELQEKHGIEVINFGHAGDGNIHTVLMKGDLIEEIWQNKRKAYLEDLYQKVGELGGLPSAEHGIGLLKKSYLEKLKSPIEINLMKWIKNAIDPSNRLNPGKIF